MSRRVLLTCLLAVWMCAMGRADVRLPAVVSDHMVLQRDSDVTIWGWADPGERVSVETGWHTGATETTADADGRWRVTGAHHRRRRAEHHHRHPVNNVLTLTLTCCTCCRVWICSGQSNMEWSFAHGVCRTVTANAPQPTTRTFACSA